MGRRWCSGATARPTVRLRPLEACWLRSTQARRACGADGVWTCETTAWYVRRGHGLLVVSSLSAGSVNKVGHELRVVAVAIGGRRMLRCCYELSRLVGEQVEGNTSKRLGQLGSAQTRSFQHKSQDQIKGYDRNNLCSLHSFFINNAMRSCSNTVDRLLSQVYRRI